MSSSTGPSSRRPGPMSRRGVGSLGVAPVGLDGAAAVLRTLPPSVGPVRLVGVDGHAGSGKSTFAARLADALGTGGGDGTASGPGAFACSPAPVLHLDDLAGHDALFAWTERLRAQVLEPLARGRTADYARYDWVRREFGERQQLPPAPVTVVEGVGAGRRFLRPYLACLLWMDVPEREAWEGGRRRDGPEQAEFWEGWMRAERSHFADDPSSPYAHLLVSRPRTERPREYGVRVGPAGLPQPPFHYPV